MYRKMNTMTKLLKKYKKRKVNKVWIKIFNSYKIILIKHKYLILNQKRRQHKLMLNPMISIIYLHMLVYFAVFTITSVLFNVKLKIAINGFVMERVRMITEAIFYGTW